MSDREPARTESAVDADIRAIDWTYCRTFVNEYVARLIGRVADASDVEDVTSEALVSVLRVVRRSGVQNLDALLTHAANLRSRDWWRRHYAGKKLSDIDDVPPTMLGTEPFDGCRQLDLVRFAILEFFERHGTSCIDLARAFFDEQDWAVVAQKTRRSHAAVRKQWSRCIEVLRQAIVAEPDSIIGRVIEEFAS